MKIAIMQPYVFPYIGYFQLINSVDKFIVYDDVGFINRGWINRNYILIRDQPFLFTIPLSKSKSLLSIREIEIKADLYKTWQTKFLKTLELNYHKAPYYIPVIELIADIITKEYHSISSLAFAGLMSICRYLDIRTQIQPTSIIYKNDYLKGSARILDICIIERATQYINSIGGKHLYSKETFEDRGIKLSFLIPQLVGYRQFGSTFTPGLSIIDVLMFNSKEDTMKMIQNPVIE